MPNRRGERAPERKLPTIFSAPRNYQQDVLECAPSAHLPGLLTHDLHSRHANSKNPRKWQPLSQVFLPASSCGIVMSRLRMASPLSVSKVFSLRAVMPRRTFCNDGNVLCRYSAQYGSHQPHMATGSWTCGKGGRRATLFIIGVINFM